MSEKKSRILYVKSFLEEQTDEAHPVGIVEILEHLTGLGIETHRRTVMLDIEQLIESGVDVAINNNYDSFTNPLSNLELSIINLANEHYNKDFALKSISAKRIKAKNGEYLALAPFGYKKSEIATEKNKLVPDEVAVEYVS